MSSKRYLLLIASLAVALCFAACSDDDPVDPGGGNPTDTTAPLIVGTGPNSGEAGVSVDDSVFVLFNEDMDTATGDGQITLSSGTVTGVTWYSDRILVAGHSGWAEGTEITATVGTGVTDAAGNALAAAYPFSFWTESTTELLLLETTPADGATDVNRDAGILLQFSSDLNMGTVDANITITDSPSKVDYDFTSSNIEDGLILLTVDQSLPADTEITVIVGTGVRTWQNLQLAAEERFSFTTGLDLDETPPTVVSTNPVNGNMSAPADQGFFSMTFSEPINPDSLDPSAWNLEFYLLLMATEVDPIWSDGGTTLTIPLPNPLPAGLPVSMTFAEFEDLAGNAQTTPYVYNVRVAGTADYVPVVDGARYLLEGMWSRGDIGNEVAFEGGYEEYFQQLDVQPDDSFRLVDYYEPEFATPGSWEAFRKASSALQWIGFLDVDPNPGKEMFDGPLNILPLPIRTGTWTSQTTVDIGGEGTFRASLAGEVLGQVDYPIPESEGRVFLKDAWKVVRTLDVDLQDGMDWIPALTEVDTIWFAVNMGDVMTVTYEEDYMDDEWESSYLLRIPFSEAFKSLESSPLRR